GCRVPARFVIRRDCDAERNRHDLPRPKASRVRTGVGSAEPLTSRAKKESSMITRKLKGVVVFAVAVLVTATGFAQTGTDRPGTAITTPGSERYSEAWYRPATRWQKMSDLIGKPVTSASGGDRIAEVKDTAVDPDAGRLLYYVIEFESKMNKGNKWFAVPVNATNLTPDAKSIVLESTI